MGRVTDAGRTEWLGGGVRAQGVGAGVWLPDGGQERRQWPPAESGPRPQRQETEESALQLQGARRSQQGELRREPSPAPKGACGLSP